MKKEFYSDYTEKDTLLSEAGLLTVWAILQDFRDELVLVGGLVPRYLCRQQTGELQAVTMDVDLGICLAMSSGIYDTTSTRLKNAGFEWEKKRFVKKIGNATLYIDFLTDKPQPDSTDSAMVDDIIVSAQPGVQRALEICREVTVCGRDLYGGKTEKKIRVCEVGPYVCLKLQAYHGRGASKDVFDMVRCVRDYDQGAKEAARLFQNEKDINHAYPIAIRMLEKEFTTEESTGPKQYANFCLGGIMADLNKPAGMSGTSGTMQTSVSGQISDDIFRINQRTNEAFDVANLLLGRR
jgi:hypothetical protein